MLELVSANQCHLCQNYVRLHTRKNSAHTIKRHNLYSVVIIIIRSSQNIKPTTAKVGFFIST